jgi:hypothetical protein
MVYLLDLRHVGMNTGQRGIAAYILTLNYLDAEAVPACRRNLQKLGGILLPSGVSTSGSPNKASSILLYSPKFSCSLRPSIFHLDSKSSLT